MECERRGVPAVLVITEPFQSLARMAARTRGFAELRTLVLPHPLESRPPAEIDRIAAAEMGALRALLVAP